MTICAAALAADSKAIVCVSDKAISYGGYIQWDTDSSKMITLNPSGSVVMLSDDGNGPRVITKLVENAGDIGGKQRSEAVAICEMQYKMAFSELVEATFLAPRMIDRASYAAAIVAPNTNDLLRSLADEIKGFKLGVDLIMCGFDNRQSPFIIEVTSPGIAADMTLVGFHAVGSGWEQATARLLLDECKRTNSIGRVLYECFDAKANAEIAVGVGYEWDAKVLVVGRKQPVEVPKNIKRIIEQIWTCKDQSPFDPDVAKEDVPPKKWKSILREFSDGCLADPTDG